MSGQGHETPIQSIPYIASAELLNIFWYNSVRGAFSVLNYKYFLRFVQYKAHFQAEL